MFIWAAVQVSLIRLERWAKIKEKSQKYASVRIIAFDIFRYLLSNPLFPKRFTQTKLLQVQPAQIPNEKYISCCVQIIKTKNFKKLIVDSNLIDHPRRQAKETFIIKLQALDIAVQPMKKKVEQPA